jgi:hypothetical protein
MYHIDKTKTKKINFKKLNKKDKPTVDKTKEDKTKNKNTKKNINKLNKSGGFKNKDITPRIKIIMYKKYLKLGNDDPTMNYNDNKCKCVNYKSQGSNIPYSELEIERCQNNPVNGSDFCLEHKNCGKFLRKFTSGYEPKYNPSAWSYPSIEGSHNCYAYFLDEQKETIKQKCEEECLKNNKSGCPKKIPECKDLIPQPGDYFLLNRYGNLKKKEREYTCPNMHNKIMSDNPHLKPVGFLERCPANFYKGAMVVDYKNTFHFYRQNPNGTWSHKPGVLPVTNKDASGKNIYIPHFSNRDYTRVPRQNPIKYTDFCGYYCIPTNEYYTTNMA